MTNHLINSCPIVCTCQTDFKEVDESFLSLKVRCHNWYLYSVSSCFENRVVYIVGFAMKLSTIDKLVCKRTKRVDVILRLGLLINRLRDKLWCNPGWNVASRNLFPSQSLILIRS